MRKGFFFILALGYMFFPTPSLCLSQRAGAALADISVAGVPMPSGAGKRPVIPGRDEGGRNFLPTDAFMKLLPLHRVKTAPGLYDWLALHPEPGQDFNDYVSSDPVLPDDRRQFIYIILIGDFDDERKRIIEETAEFIQAYYTLPVKFLPAVGADAVPAEARRSHPQTRDQQILTTYVIESVLKPLKPEDAFCLIGFTAEDLWPGEGWNFVFGQASLPDRVGIWSIYRNGDPYESNETRKACLLRTIKTGVHEIGHMFSMHHCVFFECNMNGSNHRRESDARPVWLCPVCLRKLMWGLRKDPVARLEALEDICEKLDLDAEGAFFRDSKNAWMAPQ